MRGFADGMRGAGAPWEEVVVVHRRVDSTQAFARRLLDAPGPVMARGFTVAALEQSTGRGRHGRRWESAHGLGLYATVVRRPPAAAERALPLRVGVSLCGSLRRLAVPATLKWPNDLLLDGRKVGGILIERPAGAGRGPRPALVGFGINLLHTADELPGAEAVSVALAGHRVPAFGRLLAEIVRGLDEALAVDRPSYPQDAFAEMAVHRPGQRMVLAVGDGRVEGRYSGVDETGRLEVETGERRRALTSAEVLKVQGGW